MFSTDVAADTALADMREALGELLPSGETVQATQAGGADLVDTAWA